MQRVTKKMATRGYATVSRSARQSAAAAAAPATEEAAAAQPWYAKAFTALTGVTPNIQSNANVGQNFKDLKNEVSNEQEALAKEKAKLWFFDFDYDERVSPKDILEDVIDARKKSAEFTDTTDKEEILEVARKFLPNYAVEEIETIFEDGFVPKISDNFPQGEKNLLTRLTNADWNIAQYEQASKRFENTTHWTGDFREELETYLNNMQRDASGGEVQEEIAKNKTLIKAEMDALVNKHVEFSGAAMVEPVDWAFYEKHIPVPGAVDAVRAYYNLLQQKLRVDARQFQGAVEEIEHGANAQAHVARQLQFVTMKILANARAHERKIEQWHGVVGDLTIRDTLAVSEQVNREWEQDVQEGNWDPETTYDLPESLQTSGEDAYRKWRASASRGEYDQEAVAESGNAVPHPTGAKPTPSTHDVAKEMQRRRS